MGGENDSNERRNDGGNGGKRNNNNNSSNGTNNNKEKFKGDCEELDGHGFDANRHNQADEFVKTKEKIVECIGTHFIQGHDIKATLKKEEKVKFEKPKAPPIIDATTKAMDETCQTS